MRAERLPDPDERIWELEERVRELEALLLSSSPAVSDKLSATQNKVLSVLLAREWASHAQLYEAICYGRMNPPGPENVPVIIWKMRQRLDDMGVTIHNIHGTGFYITPEDKDKLRLG